MHILLGFLGVVAAAAYWYYRLKDAGAAAAEVVDVAQRARGAWNRRQFRNKVEGSALSAIDDPAEGAAVMMIRTCLERGPLSPATEAAIKTEIRRMTGMADPAEAFAFAVWTADQVPSPNDVSLKLRKLWGEKLTAEQRHDVLAMVTRVAEVDGDLLPAQTLAIRMLQERLGIA